MSRSSFFTLPLHDKVQQLYERGSFVTAIRYYRYKVNLYQMDRNLVEVFFNHKEDRIEKIELLPRYHSRMKFYSDQVILPPNLLD